VSVPATPSRAEVVEILAAFGDRSPEQVPEGIDSMELAWLVHQIEQRYGCRLDDDDMARMATVSDALQVFRELPVGPDAPGADPEEHDHARPTPERGE
jgi:acyl carrier protein